MARIRSPYLLGSAFLVAALALFLVAFLGDDADAASEPAGFHRFGFAQGGGAVELSTGRWVGYFEAPAAVTAPTDVPAFRAFVRDPNGAQVNVRNYAGKPLDYDAGGKHGIAVLEFQASRSGRYVVQLQAPGTAPPGAALAIGRSLRDHRESASKRAQLVIGTVAALAGFAVLGWALRQRSRAPHVVSGAL